MKCPKCDTEIRNEVSFCGNCGHKIKTPKAAIIISAIFVGVIITFIVLNSNKTKDNFIEETANDKITETKKGETDGAGKPIATAKCFPADNSKYKTTGNARFDFWFDIPKEWDAIDKSANGEGYSFITNVEGVEGGVWGSYKVFSDEEYYNDIYENKTVFEDFIFRDGAKGKYIQEKTTHNYIRNEEDRRIKFSVTCSVEWFKNNQDIIIHIAKSLRPGKKVIRKIYFNPKFSDDVEVQNDLDYYAANIKNSEFVKEYNIEVLISDKYPKSAVVFVENDNSIFKDYSAGTDIDIIMKAKELFKLKE